MARLPFIDVGDSQGSVDWERLRERGKAVIAACKATEGQDFRAETFSGARVAAVHKAGLPPMPHHYLRPRTDRHGSREAEFAELKVFSGIGHFAQNGLVRHVDVRHVGPNTTGGTKARPTIFVDQF